METQEKEVVRRFYEIVNSGRYDDLDTICAPDMVGHAGAGADLAELKKSLAAFAERFRTCVSSCGTWCRRET